MSSAVMSDRDAELLRRWSRDGDDEAFAVLLERYRRLVAGVCRRQSRNEHDAEDAFQAVFYLLARDAGAIRHPERLPGWLHTVAMRVAIRIRESGDMKTASVDDAAVADIPSPLDRLSETHQLRTLDEEIARLPDRYRQPVVLHFLEGRTYAETAERLETSVGSIRGLLRSGTRRLRRRLVRRGVSLAGAVALLAITERRAAALDVSTEALRQRLAEATPPRGIDPGTTFASLTTSTSTAGALAMPIPVLLILLGLLTAATAVLVPAGGGPADVEPTAQLSAAAQADTAAVLVGTPQQDRRGANGDRQADSAAQPVAQWVGGNAASYARIESALDDPISMQFLDEPLESVAQVMSDRHQIPIVIDTRALEDLGLTRDAPITIDLPEVQLASALNLILDDLDLTYTVNNDVLIITSVDAVEGKYQTTRVYWLGDSALNPTTVEEVIQQNIDPTTWSDVGGSSQISPIQVGAGKSGLVITAPYRTHRKVASLLEALAGGPSAAAPLGSATRTTRRSPPRGDAAAPSGPADDPFRGADPFGGGGQPKGENDPFGTAPSRASIDDPFGT